jgi:hypothetical protein
MGERQWQPGDVALVGGTDGEVVAVWQGNQWATATARYLHDFQVTARPLVVIDPEDAEQVERLASALTAALINVPGGGCMRPETTQAALREFANPKPPTCSAHGEAACADCSRITDHYLTIGGGCTSCGVYESTGMHSDTCPGRIGGRVYASRDEAREVNP